MPFYPLVADIFMITLSNLLENLLFNTYQNSELCMCLLFFITLFNYFLYIALDCPTLPSPQLYWSDVFKF